MQVQGQQIAQASMTAKDWWPIIIGALSAVVAAFGAAFMTLWWQRRTETRNSKLRVFSTLMMHRRANPPNVDWVNAVNLIDVVFADDAAVLAKWHDLYGILNNAPQVGSEVHRHTYLEMLSEMAKALNFKKLQQTDIDKFYSPQVYAVQAATQQEFQNLAKTFFEGANRLFAAAQQQPGQPPNPADKRTR